MSDGDNEKKNRTTKASTSYFVIDGRVYLSTVYLVHPADAKLVQSSLQGAVFGLVERGDSWILRPLLQELQNGYLNLCREDFIQNQKYFNQIITIIYEES
jgi:hypothetical protein